MKTLYNYIVERLNRASLGSLTFIDLDDFVKDDLEQICDACDVDLEIIDAGPTGEGPWAVEIYPSISTWGDKGFAGKIIKLGNELNPSGKMCNISFLNVTGFKYEAIMNYLKEHKYKEIENHEEGSFQVFEYITSKDIEEFLNIIENDNENLTESYGCNQETFKKEWEKMLSKKIPAFTFPSGDIVYINYNEEDNCLDAGGMTNSGVDARFSLEIDYDHDLDYNLQDLYDMVIDENPEYLNDEDE